MVFTSKIFLNESDCIHEYNQTLFLNLIIFLAIPELSKSWYLKIKHYRIDKSEN